MLLFVLIVGVLVFLFVIIVWCIMFGEVVWCFYLLWFVGCYELFDNRLRGLMVLLVTWLQHLLLLVVVYSSLI